MSARPYWKGYLKLSLISCPIALHAACSSAERVSFRQINRKTGNRLRQQLIDEETREPVEGYDKARGYEIGKNQFLLVEDEELEAIEIESTHTIDIDSFVPRADIDQRLFDMPYYITPNDPVGQDVTPRLTLTSPLRGCGKTTLLDLLEALCVRSLKSDSITAASIYHAVDREHHREHRLDTSRRPTPWLGISDSNFDVQSENSSL